MSTIPFFIVTLTHATWAEALECVHHLPAEAMPAASMIAPRLAKNSTFPISSMALPGQPWEYTARNAASSGSTARSSANRDASSSASTWVKRTNWQRERIVGSILAAFRKQIMLIR